MRRILLAAGGGASFVIPDSQLAGFYNGKVGAPPQRMYFASSTDSGQSFTIGNGGAAVIDVGAGGTWCDEYIAQGSLIREGSTYALYLSGYDGTFWKIGRWTSATLSDSPGAWTPDAGNPIISVGGAGSADAQGANLPHCEYDAGTTRIWYAGWHDGITTISYAERSSGGTVTKYGEVLAEGGVGDFDEVGMETGPPLTIGGEKRLYYDGFNASAHYTAGYATYTDPRVAGTYTKHGAFADLTGPITVSDGDFNSTHIHSILPRLGGYIVSVTLFHPVGSANQREIAAYSFSADGLTFSAPVGPTIAMTTAFPNVESKENLTVLVA